MLRICTITFFVLRRLLQRAFKTHLLLLILASSEAPTVRFDFLCRSTKKGNGRFRGSVPYKVQLLKYTNGVIALCLFFQCDFYVVQSTRIVYPFFPLLGSTFPVYYTPGTASALIMRCRTTIKNIYFHFWSDVRTAFFTPSCWWGTPLFCTLKVYHIFILLASFVILTTISFRYLII